MTQRTVKRAMRASLLSSAKQNSVAGRATRLFERFATAVARLAGKPVTFLVMVALLLLWGLSGPLLGFSDTWQLMVNTATTVITFLMVFVIQHTQNRDTLAIQIKLAELILAAKGAENELAAAEERSEDYLEQLHERIIAGDGLDAVRAVSAATARSGKQRQANGKGKSASSSPRRNAAAPRNTSSGGD